jgi:hypothetical protein
MSGAIYPGAEEWIYKRWFSKEGGGCLIWSKINGRIWKIEAYRLTQRHTIVIDNKNWNRKFNLSL